MSTLCTTTLGHRTLQTGVVVPPQPLSRGLLAYQLSYHAFIVRPPIATNSRRRYTKLKGGFRAAGIHPSFRKHLYCYNNT